MPTNKLHNKMAWALSFALLVALFIGMRFGAVEISNTEIFSALKKTFSCGDLTLNERIFMQIRLPRAVLCVIAGAALAVGGTLMQGLFRNPIVEPGLVGTSSGAAFGASLYFVLGTALHFNAGECTLPIAACAGGMLATLLVYFLVPGGRLQKNSVIPLLLTGIAVNALCLSGVGFLSYIARDPQARSITFWGLGTLSGAGWHSCLITAVSTITCILLAYPYAKQLNALMLGEDEAALLGANIRRLKLSLMAINVVMVAVVTAFTGIISFVGLIVPHLLRIAGGA
ncbi:MAG TPA: iron ABC transporter permease, partial [Chitinophagales bacterium]|nr:iron ABC transporter permease [Chitinophagales bacterium]